MHQRNRRILVTGLPGKSSHKMGFRSSVSKNGHPGEGKHEGLVRRNDVNNNNTYIALIRMRSKRFTSIVLQYDLEI